MAVRSQSTRVRDRVEPQYKYLLFIHGAGLIRPDFHHRGRTRVELVTMRVYERPAVKITEISCGLGQAAHPGGDRGIEAIHPAMIIQPTALPLRHGPFTMQIDGSPGVRLAKGNDRRGETDLNRFNAGYRALGKELSHTRSTRRCSFKLILQ